MYIYHDHLSGLIGELQAKLEEAKIEITKRSEAYAEKQRELISSKLLGSMDEASLGEIRDNTWLHKQVRDSTVSSPGSTQ